MLSTGVARGSLCFFSPSLSRADRRVSTSSFFNLPGPGLQGAKSFVRDRNGLRISARAHPQSAAVDSRGGEILKALGGIKEIFRCARDASARPEDLRLLSFFRYETAFHHDVIYAGTAGQAICELTPYFLRVLPPFLAIILEFQRQRFLQSTERVNHSAVESLTIKSN